MQSEGLNSVSSGQIVECLMVIQGGHSGFCDDYQHLKWLDKAVGKRSCEDLDRGEDSFGANEDSEEFGSLDDACEGCSARNGVRKADEKRVQR